MRRAYESSPCADMAELKFKKPKKRGMAPKRCGSWYSGYRIMQKAQKR